MLGDPDIIEYQSGVFLFTMAFQEGLVMCSLVWTLGLIGIRLFANIEFNILQWTITTLLVGSAVQFIVFGLKLILFRNPVTNAEILTLFEEVRDELGASRRIQLWSRSTDKGVFLSTSNLLFKAILLSESAIGNILGKREKGKVVLAREVLMLGRVNPIRGFALGLFGFWGVSFSELFFFVYDEFLTMELWVTTMLLAFVVLLLGLILIPTMTSKSYRHVERILENTYGSSP